MMDNGKELRVKKLETSAMGLWAVRRDMDLHRWDPKTDDRLMLLVRHTYPLSEN